jgi:hypothetical protein
MAERETEARNRAGRSAAHGPFCAAKGIGITMNLTAGLAGGNFDVCGCVRKRGVKENVEGADDSFQTKCSIALRQLKKRSRPERLLSVFEQF